MERQNTSRKNISNKDNDISFKVFCLSPTVKSSEGRDTSVYEIDIESDFEFHGGQMKGKEYPVGVPISRDSGIESSKKEAKSKDHKNPFFQAYYPNFLHPHTEENETQSKTVRETETQSETVGESETQSKTVREIETQSETVRENEIQPKTVREIETQSETVGEGKTQSKTVRETETQSETVEENKTQSKTVRETETQSVTVRENETQSETVGENETQSKTVRETETQSVTVRKNETQSQAVRETETQSVTVRENETQSEAVGVNEKPQMTMAEEKKESSVEKVKVDKENQSSSVLDNKKLLQKRIKSFLIENFFSKNKNDLKAMFRNYENKLDTNELHLHHHEHHHHYYFDGSFMSERSSSSSSKKEHTKSKKSRENKSHEEDMFEKLNKTTNYVSEFSSSTTFTHVKMTSDETRNPNMKGNVSEGVDESLEQAPSFPLQSSVSVESILRKKSDFVKSHMYSDTDLTKSENQVVESIAKDSRKSSRSNYSILVNSLKNLNQLRSPLIITDQQTVPKFSYITCECTSVDTLGNMSSISLFSTDHLEEVDEDARISCESKESIISTGAGKIEARKSERKLYFDLWKAKLKTEIREIKEDLQRFEKAHFKKKDSFPAQPRIETAAQEKGAEHKIAVYSSKTFIMGSENVFLRKNCPYKEFLMRKSRKAYEESLRNGTSLRPAERKVNFTRKRARRSVPTGVLQRV